MTARRLLIRLLAVVFSATVAQSQDAPLLAVHVTDQGADAFVAIYGGQAVELVGCADLAAARDLLQLPADAAVRETTLADLQAGFALGSQPRLPCDARGFDASWPATTPIWADLERSGTYLLPALTGTGFVAVPARCAAIKTALAIRERLQLPGVLQSTSAPPGMGTPALVLDCGAALPAGTTLPAAPSVSGWSLHRFETFLTEDSVGDTIYVARNIASEGAAPSYLPILRVDGQDTRDLILTGGLAMEAVEAALSRLIGAPQGAAVSLLGSDEVPALREALYADLCLNDCGTHVPEHGAFLRPGIDLGLTAIPPLPVSGGMDVLGAARVTMNYAEGRKVSFTGCPALTAALGLTPPESGDWFARAEAALADDPTEGMGFDCRAGGADTCTRRLADGGNLTAASFATGPDCPAARHLRLELPSFIPTLEPLVLQGLAFETVTLLPAPGVTRVRLLATPGLRATSSDTCVLSPAAVLIAASGLDQLRLIRIDLDRRATDFAGAVVALQAQGGTLVLQDTSLGATPDGSVPVQRGINLCRADLYAQASRIQAEDIALQGLQSHVLLSADGDLRMMLTRARFGLLMAAQSQIVLQDTDIVATSPVVLRGAELRASRTSLMATAPVPPAGSALQLERASQAELTISTVAGFRCAASFIDAASRLAFLLPGNDIARDNTFPACGPGQFSLIE